MFQVVADDDAADAAENDRLIQCGLLLVTLSVQKPASVRPAHVKVQPTGRETRDTTRERDNRSTGVDRDGTEAPRLGWCGRSLEFTHNGEGFVLRRLKTLFG